MNSYILLGLGALIIVPATASGLYLFSGSKDSVDINNENTPGSKQQEKNTSKVSDSAHNNIDANGEKSTSLKSKIEPKLTDQQLRFPNVTTNLLGASQGQAGSIGSKFEQYLLSDATSEEWKDKVRKWVTLFLGDNRNQLTSEFISTSSKSSSQQTEWSWMSITTLQSRCKKAYSKTNWKNDFGSNSSINTDNYWTTVKDLCGKSNVSFPETWNTSN